MAVGDITQTETLTVGVACDFPVKSVYATGTPAAVWVDGDFPAGLRSSFADSAYTDIASHTRIYGTPTAAGVYRSVWRNFRNKPGQPGAPVTTLILDVRIRDVPRPSIPTASPTDAQSGTVTAATAPAVRLNWFQARAEAFAGVRIRRAGWVNRYVEYDRGLWFLQLLNATTRVLGERRVVQAADWSADEFRALDWTYEDIVGQSPAAGQASAAVPPTLRWP